MVIKQIILSTLIILGNCSLFGQSIEQADTPPNTKKHIITLSYSPMLLFASFEPLLDDFDDYSGFAVIRGEYGVRAVYYDYANSGIFSLAYGRQ
jgi:hypothetical protein